MKFFTYLSLFSILLFTACLNSIDPYDDTQDLAFLEEYAQREGVITTDSGLMYRILEESEEGVSPTSDQLSIITYKGESVDQSHVLEVPHQDGGIQFEMVRPEEMVSFTGLGEGVQLMKEGDKFEFVLPSELAAHSGRVFTFELTLESVIQQNQEQFYDDNATLEGVEVTQSGLQYRVIEEGTGDTPLPSSEVTVKYKGYYTNGYIFDRTSGNNTADFPVNGVISGFSEGLQLMKEGATYELFIPPSLGYGNSHPQYGAAILVFEVELVKIN